MIELTYMQVVLIIACGAVAAIGLAVTIVAIEDWWKRRK